VSVIRGENGERIDQPTDADQNKSLTRGCLDDCLTLTHTCVSYLCGGHSVASELVLHLAPTSTRTHKTLGW